MTGHALIFNPSGAAPIADPAGRFDLPGLDVKGFRMMKAMACARLSSGGGPAIGRRRRRRLLQWGRHIAQHRLHRVGGRRRALQQLLKPVETIAKRREVAVLECFAGLANQFACLFQLLESFRRRANRRAIGLRRFVLACCSNQLSFKNLIERLAQRFLHRHLLPVRNDHAA